MVEKDHKGATHVMWRRMRVFGILLLLTVVQGNSPSMNPVTLTQGNMIDDSNLINPNTTMRSPVDAPPSITQLTFNTGIDARASISSDGSKIAFHSDVDGDYEIFIVNTDGSGLTQLTHNTVEDLFPAISGDGSKIVFH